MQNFMKTSTLQIFSVRLKKLRTEAKLSQTHLATQMKVSPYSIGDWERNRSTPPLNLLIHLADFFECSIDYMLGRKNVSDIISIEQNIFMIKNIRNKDTFATRLKELRIDAGLSQTQLSVKMKVLPYTIGDWERNRTAPSFNMLVMLADIFDCSIDYLLGRENFAGIICIAKKDFFC